jgi:hypothetical protein
MANKRVRRLIVSIPLIIAALLAAVGHSSSADDVLLGREVARFSSANENIFDALLRFGRVNHVPMGLVLSLGPCSTVLSDVKIGHVSVQEALTRLTHEIPSYSWRLENGAVVIAPKDLPSATTMFLDTKVAPYRISQDTLQAQVAYAWMNIRATLRPNEGTAFNVLSTPQSPKWPALSVGNITVLELLNRLIARGSSAAWILVPSDDLQQIAASRPFWVVDYSSSGPQEHSTACGGSLQPHTK